MKALRTAVLGTMIVGCASVLAATENGAETSIPFVNMSQSIHGWQADGQMALWIQDARDQWFYAKLAGPCLGLEFTAQLGFEPKTNNSLDKFGNVIMANKRCQMTSLTKSDAPPKEKKAGKSGATK